MELWGGENLELSFKAWQCGGHVAVAPCSRVGHVFRPWTPYKLSPDTITRNNRRVAEVWMDDFKHLFFDRQAGSFCGGEMSTRLQSTNMLLQNGETPPPV